MGPALFGRTLNDVTHGRDFANDTVTLTGLGLPHALVLLASDLPFLISASFDVC